MTKVSVLQAMKQCQVSLVGKARECIGQERLIQSHSSARFYFELNGNSN